MIRYVGPLLIATAVLHTAVGMWIFRDPLAAILRDGFVNAVDADALRRNAFWFLLFSPVLAGLGMITNRALAAGDLGVLAVVGWSLLGMGVVGAAAMPVSGFWILIALSLPVLAELYGSAPA